MTLWQRTQLLTDKQIFNNLASLLKQQTLNRLRNENFSSQISSLTSKNGSFWRATRNYLKQKPMNSTLKKDDATKDAKQMKKNLNFFALI